MPEEITNAIEIIPATNVEEVLKVALARMPDPITWEEDAAASAVAAGDEKGNPRVTAH